LILLLVDSSEKIRNIRIKLESSLDILRQLDVGPSRILLVLNKVDVIEENSIPTIEGEYSARGFKTVKISALRGEGMHQLKLQISERVKGPVGLHIDFR